VIRAVSFDVGGTLIEPWPSVGHVYASVAARFGLAEVAPEDLNRQFGSAWKARRDFNYSRDAWRELVNASFAGLAPMAPSLECFDAMYDAFARPEPWRIFDDVLPTLAAGRDRGWKLAIGSNWDERLRPLLRELKLEDYFDVIVISHDVGVTKPSRGLFDRVASELGVPAETVLHIGDGVEEDWRGAIAAGMRSLLLDRKGRGEEPAAVRTLAAVLDFPSSRVAAGNPD
jgi:putative hydrolase of the HAD superfamily